MRAQIQIYRGVKMWLVTKFMSGGKRIKEIPKPITSDEEDWRESCAGTLLMTRLKDEQISIPENVTYQQAEQYWAAFRSLSKVWRDQFNTNLPDNMRNELVEYVISESGIAHLLSSVRVVSKNSKNYCHLILIISMIRQKHGLTADSPE